MFTDKCQMKKRPISLYLEKVIVGIQCIGAERTTLEFKVWIIFLDQSFISHITLDRYYQ